MYDVCKYSARVYAANGNYSFPKDVLVDVGNFCQIPLEDIVVVLGLAILWTVGRQLLTDKVFKPIGRWLHILPENVDKMPESAWKLLYYSSLWVYTIYVVILKGKYRFFQQPSTVWDGWSTQMVVPSDIYWIYAIQSSYYVHGMYAVVYQDIWRKDSVVMLLHHTLTLVLLWMSYVFRCHNIGVLVLVLHDLSDILLEFSKLNVYLKVRGGKLHSIHDHMATVAFACFAITWFITRLYYYPRKVMYAATTGLFMKQVFPSYFFALDCLLTVLLLMNLYWFVLIVLFAVRVLTGDIKELDDTREYDVAQKLDTSRKGALPNGTPQLPSPTKKLEKNGNGCHNGTTSWPGPQGDSGSLRERRVAAES